MDHLDLAILGAMFEDGAIRLGGWDPRISTTEVALRLGVPASTVKSRYRRWVSSGFLNGFLVFPHPKFLGAELVGQDFEFDSSRLLGRFIEMAGRVPNLVHGYQGDVDGCWVAYLDDGSHPSLHGLQMFSSIPGVSRSKILSAYHQGHRYLMASCTRETLSRLDWRIILQLRADPRQPLLRVAKNLEVSFKTIRRRFDRMMDNHAIFFMPLLDFEKWDGILMKFHLDLLQNANLNEIWKRIRGLHAVILPHALWYDPLFRWGPPNVPPGWGIGIEYLASLDSPGESLTVRRHLSGISGVQVAYAGTPIRVWGFPEAYDRAIARAVLAAGVVVAPRALKEG